MQTKLNLWKVEKKNPEVIPFPIKANDVENKSIRAIDMLKKITYYVNMY